MSSNLVELYLKKHGPSRSSEITKFLISKHGLSSDSARQRVSRAKGMVQRLKGLRFESGEMFLFLSSQIGTSSFYERLMDAIIKSDSAAGRAMRAIHVRGGAIYEKDFAGVSGAITVDRRGHIRSDALLQVLLKYRVLESATAKNGEKALITYKNNNWEKQFEARWHSEIVALNLLKLWATKTNFASFRKVKMRSEKYSPEFGGYNWDLTAPCYLRPLRTWSKTGTVNPSFLAIDVILRKNLSENDLSAFMHKVAAVNAQQKIPPILPMLVCDGFTPEGLKKIRDLGCITASTDVIFGKEAAELLRSLTLVMENAAAAIVKDPNGVFSLFERLRALEIDLQPIRGPLFEYIIADLLHNEGFKIDVGRQIRTSQGEEADIDIKAQRGATVISAECKGFGPGSVLGQDIVDDWLSRQVPRIREWFEFGKRSRHMSGEIEFHFYFSGNFDSDIKNYCESVKGRSKKYRIEFFDYSEIVKRLKSEKVDAALKKLNDFFT